MRALFAVDLDEAPDAVETAFANGRALLDPLGATVDLLFVDDGEAALAAADDALGLLVNALIERRERCRKQLDALLERVPAARRGHARVVSSTRAADTIADRALGSDVVVVGTHGRTGLPRLWVGSVAERVVRSCPVPVLVARPGPARTGPPRVLAAVDLLHAPGEVVKQAGRWAAELGGVVDAVHVVGLPDPMLVEFAVPWGAESEALLRSVGERLARALEALPADVRGRTKVERGLPGPTVVEAAEGYTLVVAGTHARRGLAHLVIGSVAERIVRASPTSVLVVPLPGG